MKLNWILKNDKISMHLFGKFNPLIFATTSFILAQPRGIMLNLKKKRLNFLQNV